MTEQKMRLRFAPSPTGALHIGGVRTALYDYLLAKKHGGDFILRIEDTDQTRFVPGAEEYIIEALKWCGIVPNEGQGFGGDYGPYRQSERKEIYEKHVNKLLSKGHAYFAFDTAEELDAMRAQVRSEGKHVFQYDASIRMQMKNSLSLSTAEVEKLLESGVPYTVRLKVPENEEVTVDDIIRGQVTFKTRELDDKVLMKSDGLPTYHLANVVDDHLMKITHVIRGEEWLPSTGHHILMYQFFEWTDSMPQFAHLPLILKPSPDSYITKANKVSLAERLVDEFFQKNNEVNQSYRGDALAFLSQIFQDKKNVVAKLKISKKDDENKRALKTFLKSNLSGKLSKRDGDRLGFPVFPLSWVGDTEGDSFIGFREMGFDKNAMNNFLVFLGWNPGTEQELFSMEEMIEAFSLERVGKSGAKFDYDKACWFNQQYLINGDDTAIAEKLQPLVAAQGWEVSDDFLTKVAGMMKERVHFTNEIVETGYYFFEPVKVYDEKTIQKRWNPDRRTQMNELVDVLKNSDSFDAVILEQGVKDFMEKNELGFGQVFPILRIALTGTMKGPSVFELIELLGKEEVVNRMNTAYEYFDDVKAKVS